MVFLWLGQTVFIAFKVQVWVAEEVDDRTFFWLKFFCGLEAGHELCEALAK